MKGSLKFRWRKTARQLWQVLWVMEGLMVIMVVWLLLLWGTWHVMSWLSQEN
ncbi:hypothetical protein ABT880_001140 [Salmonella enterica subsp. enterica serovar Thompson]|nr:hypothetical protein [Salmonella enterica]EDT1690136.1 hypothetical protein [Salmonella enterica subsp. enterica serovar Oslo]EJO8772287.1 hypothetical protein [Salmonella enterica subsp. enterica serovar Newport]ELP3484163.1 hypothetical protein [Salmonella enterica]EMC1106816.1 hypothetical protein [Salmonella enterica]